MGWWSRSNRGREPGKSARVLSRLSTRPRGKNNSSEAAFGFYVARDVLRLRQIFIGPDTHAVRDLAVGNRRGLDERLNAVVGD